MKGVIKREDFEENSRKDNAGAKNIRVSYAKIPLADPQMQLS
jgi:hypothetical protein